MGSPPASAHPGLAAALLGLGQREAALAATDAALTINPAHTAALETRAAALAAPPDPEPEGEGENAAPIPARGA